MRAQRRFFAATPWTGGPSEFDSSGRTIYDLALHDPLTNGQPHAVVPLGKTWRIESVVVVNYTPVQGYISVGLFPSSTASPYIPPDLSKGLTSAGGAGGAENVPGPFLLQSRPIPPRTTKCFDYDQVMYEGQAIYAGAFPGRNQLWGLGGIGLIVSGVEHRG